MLAFSLDSIEDFYNGKLIYTPRRPTVTNCLPARVAAPSPAETCCDCGIDHYEHELCNECGYCFACCDCPPAPERPEDELADDPEYTRWLHLLDRADEDWETRGDID